MAANKALSTAFRGVRVFMPEYTVALVRPSSNPMPIQQGQVATHPKSGRPIYPRNEAVRRERAPNDLVFRVDMKMNKPEIKNYLSSIYGLEVERVNTQIVLGKTKRNRRTNHRNKRADYKLAYVTLPEGQHFEFPSKELLFELETDE